LQKITHVRRGDSKRDGLYVDATGYLRIARMLLNLTRDEADGSDSPLSIHAEQGSA
jgi:hypothetical protein